MLDDIDYSALQGTTETPKAKPTVSDRSVVKQVKKKQIDQEALTQKAEQLSTSIGEPEIGDPLAQYALPVMGGVGVLGALAAAYSAWKKGMSNADYSKQKPGEFSVPADQKGTQAVQSVEKNVAEAATVDKLEQLQQRVEAGRAAGINQTPVQGGVTPPAAPAPVPAPVAPQPVAQTPVTATEAVATGQSPSKAIQLDVAQQLDATPAGAVAPETEVKKRAAKTTKTFKSEAAIPPGTVFRSDLGNLDRSLYNVLGPEHRRNAMELLNQGKPFGNVQDVNAAVKDVTSRYWQTLQSQIPETILGREERAAQGLKSEFGNYGALGKAAKVAGVAGTLLSIADLAKAAQQTKEGQYGEAAKTVIPVIDPTGLGTAAVQPENTAQMLTNVAPFLGMISQMIGAKTKAPKGAAIPR